MHARFESIIAIGLGRTKILRLQGAEEAINHRVAKAFAFAAHALFDFTSR